MSVKANVITMLKRKLSLGKNDEVLRVSGKWIDRAETAEKKVAELEAEVKSLKQQNAALEDMMDRGGE